MNTQLLRHFYLGLDLCVAADPFYVTIDVSAARHTPINVTPPILCFHADKYFSEKKSIIL